jgi:type IV secretory pathway VirB2 component (pilin)
LSLAILIVIWTVTLGIMAIRGNYNIRVMAAVVTYFGAAIIQSIIFSWGRKVLELFTK